MILRLIIFSLLFSALPAHALIVNSDTFTGNGIDNRTITGATACTPDVVIVKRNEAALHAYISTSTMPASTSHFLTNTSSTPASLCVKSFVSTGFTVGTNTYCNASGDDHYYVSLCPNGANDMEVGTYTGDGTDNRDITMSASWTPELVIIVTEGTARRVWRGSTSHSGDSSSSISGPDADAANYIQSVGAGTFQVGTSSNTNTVPFHWIALKGDAVGIVTGSFTGDTNDNRDITAGFQPEFVMVKHASTTDGPSYRFAGMSGDLSFCLSEVAAANQIQALGATTFQVGTDACSNSSGTTMRWFALTDTSVSGFYIRRRNQ